MHRMLASVLTLLVAAAPSACAPLMRALEDAPAARATVTRHIDGDTFEVRLAGRLERVRFIGIDTPERGDPGFAEASAFTARAAPVGARVFLELDVEERDRYGRLLAYVWLDDPETADPRRGMLNARLIAAGHAVPLTIPPNVAHADLFVLLSRSSASRAGPRS